MWSGGFAVVEKSDSVHRCHKLETVSQPFEIRERLGNRLKRSIHAHRKGRRCTRVESIMRSGSTKLRHIQDSFAMSNEFSLSAVHITFVEPESQQLRVDVFHPRLHRIIVMWRYRNVVRILCLPNFGLGTGVCLKITVPI